MDKQTRILSTLLVGALAVLVLAAPGQGTPSEVVTCSSQTTILNRSRTTVILTGTWIASDGTYSLRQIGSCLWWSGGPASRVNVFFGTVSSSGSTVFGLWADVRRSGSGKLILSIDSSQNRLTRRGSTGGLLAKMWTRRP